MFITIKGDFACYTMPEAKVERMSYPVITPSAARAVVSAGPLLPSRERELKPAYILSALFY